MAEYIEREAYIKMVQDIPMWGSVAAMMADTLPAADVEPVRHARWVFRTQRFRNGGFWSEYGCSECIHGEEVPIGSRLPNYCPKCGGKMDLDVSE